MKIQYKFNILTELKKAGYSSYKLQKENILGQQTIQKIRQGIVVYGTTLEKLCELLNCQPGDILEYIPDEQDDNQNDNQSYN